MGSTWRALAGQNTAAHTGYGTDEYKQEQIIPIPVLHRGGYTYRGKDSKPHRVEREHNFIIGCPESSGQPFFFRI